MKYKKGDVVKVKTIQQIKLIDYKEHGIVPLDTDLCNKIGVIKDSADSTWKYLNVIIKGSKTFSIFLKIEVNKYNPNKKLYKHILKL